MKNLDNKGFTLIELLATIVILSVVLVIATMSVFKIINESKEKSKYASAREITSIAAAYLTAETDGVETIGEKKCISIKKLIENGYLEKDATNPATGENSFEGYENSKICKGDYTNQSGNKVGTNEEGELGYSFDDFYYVIVDSSNQPPDNEDSSVVDVTESEYYKYYRWNNTKLLGLSAEGEEYFKTNKELIIPEGTTEIADGALLVPYGYTGTIPNFQSYESSLNDIAEYNRKNNRLTGVTLTFPETLKKIGNFSFASLSATGDLILPNNIDEIGIYAFYSNNFNGNLKLPEKLEIIKDYSFGANQFTGDLLIPSGTKEIGYGAFHMAGFTGNLKLSQGLKKVGHYAFYMCNFIGDLVIPDSVTEIGVVSFGIGYTGSLTLSKNLTEIPQMAFVGTGFTGELYIPDNIKNIKYEAFRNCKNITSVSISSNTTYVEKQGTDETGMRIDVSFPSNVVIKKR